MKSHLASLVDDFVFSSVQNKAFSGAALSLLMFIFLGIYSILGEY